MPELYKDPVITKYIDLFKSVFGDRIKEYYYGDPVRIPVSNTPCMIISKDQTQVGHLTNAEDEHGMQMVITVVTDIRNDLSDYSNIVAGINTLYDLIEGRNANYTLKSQTVLNVLRNNVEVDIANGLRTDLGTVTVADYGMTINKRTETGWAMEAQVKFIAYFTQVR